MDPYHQCRHGVQLAKQAYVDGKIDLATLEQALEDRLEGPPYNHDRRIDGYVPADVRGDTDPEPY